MSSQGSSPSTPSTPTPTPSDAPAAPTPGGSGGGGGGSPPPSSTTTNSNSKKRKRLTEDERVFREKERAEKRQKLEEEKIKKEEERRQKEQERLEKLKQKEQERLQKEQERIEKERIKEQERLEKERERLEKERIKEQERLKREEENLKKAEEKRKKEEERIKKEEERLKKEEERKKALEEKEKERLKLEEKKAKQAQHFTKFFQKSPAPTSKVRTLIVNSSPVGDALAGGSATDPECDKENSEQLERSKNEGSHSALSDCNSIVKSEGGGDGNDSLGNEDIKVVYTRKSDTPRFRPMPFEIKSNMAIAPLLRRSVLTALERNNIDLCVKSSASCKDKDASEEEKEMNSDFIQRCRNKCGRKMGRTDVEVDGEVAVIIQDVALEGTKRYRKKLLQFHDNRRPAYWGTWKKLSEVITGRRPFEKEKELDYEFDSDDEWEDEPEDGEEIENSDGEDEPEDIADGEPVDEENDDGWMVPHGYFSEDEREGEGDIEEAKKKEAAFFSSLKEQVKLGIPVIQTVKLSGYRIIFPRQPKVVRRSTRTPKIPTHDTDAKGFLGMDLPSDDEEDTDWNENDASTLNDEDKEEGDDNDGSSDSSDYESDAEEQDLPDLDSTEMEVDGNDDDDIDLSVERDDGSDASDEGSEEEEELEERMETESVDSNDDLFTAVVVKKGSNPEKSISPVKSPSYNNNDGSPTLESSPTGVNQI